MKHFAQAVLAVTILMAAFTAVNPASAATLGLTRPFGGRVLTPIPGVSCPGVGPITIQPVGSSISMPFFFPIGQKSPPSSGRWVLGNHLVIQTPVCTTTTAPPVPFPVYTVTLYGVSKGF